MTGFRFLAFPSLVLAAMITACVPAPPPPTAGVAASPPRSSPAGDPVEGLRVATRVGCNGCHGGDGGGRVFMDHPEAGLIVAPNLTTRRALYDDAALQALLREGVTHDGHPPVGMPVFMFQHLSDRELRDIIAWLRAIPAVENPELPDSAWSETVHGQLRDGTYPFIDDLRPNPGNDPPAVPPVQTLALGRHLAMTTCSECHGPALDGWGGEDGVSLVVAKAYSADAFARLMRTGITAAGGESMPSGLMSKVARSRFSVLTHEEVSALKAYLDSR
jgi:mono/diheme cytochrome c family protein